jgi:hypothetical protein
MSSYRKPKHVYNDNWEDSHPFTDRVAVTSGEDDGDDEEMEWKGCPLAIASYLDRL